MNSSQRPCSRYVTSDLVGTLAPVGGHDITTKAKGFFDKFEFVSKTNVEVSVGAQIGIEGKVVIGDVPLEINLEAGYEVHSLAKLKIDPFTTVNDPNKKPFEFTTGDPINPETGDRTVKDYAGGGIGIPNTFMLGGSYTQNSDYYNSYYDNSKRTGVQSYEWEAFAKKGSGSNAMLSPTSAAKVGNTFYGLDVGGGIKAVFGIEFNFKIGFSKK